MAISEALQKVIDYRDSIHSDKEKIMPEDGSYVIYKGVTSTNKLTAYGYVGKSKKTRFAIAFSTETRRTQIINEFIVKQENKAKEKIEIKKERNKPVELAVNDILYSSWGYEQTNIDFYLVTRLIGKQSVEIVEIGKFCVSTGDMQGNVTPDTSIIKSDPMTKRVSNGNNVRVHDYSSATPLDYDLIGGVKLYKPKAYTSYA